MKTRPLLIAATVLLFMLRGYFGAYYANLAGNSIRYYDPRGAFMQDMNREAPRYRFAQRTSEVVFWPADKIDGMLNPERFDFGPEVQKDWQLEWRQ